MNDLETLCKTAANAMYRDIYQSEGNASLTIEKMAEGIRRAITIYCEMCKIRGVIPGSNYVGIEF